MENYFNDDDRQYLQMMQENIVRMANNSANCKSWMISIVTGILAIGCGIETLKMWVLLAFIPIISFWYLDTYYLQMERKMRNRQLDFLLKARISNTNDAYKLALFCFKPKEMIKLSKEEEEKGFVITDDRFDTKSILPVYLGAGFIVIAVVLVLNYVS